MFYSCTKHCTFPNYKVTQHSDGKDMSSGIRCYTDGSKTEYGVGSGLCIIENDKVIKTRAIGLTGQSTVFQAEIQAIRLATILIPMTLPKGSTVTILSDSQAALLALENTMTKSRIVLRTKTLLNNLGKEYKVHLTWIKAHVGNKGNEIADQVI